MSIGFFRGTHSFDALITQEPREITPLNPFDAEASALSRTPGVKSAILAAHKICREQIPSEIFILTWKVGVEYKYGGLRTIVTIQPNVAND